MNIFAYFRRQTPQRPAWLMPEWRVNFPPAQDANFFQPTHMHVKTGKLYMLTGIGERLEVTGDEAYPLAEYEDSQGNRYAQRADRFHDGRFREVLL